MRLQPPHISETEEENRKEQIGRDVVRPRRNRIDGDEQNRQKGESSHPWNYCVPPKAEVLGKFATDVRGQCEVGHRVQDNCCQCGDGSEKAEDVSRSQQQANQKDWYDSAELQKCDGEGWGAMD